MNISSEAETIVRTTAALLATRPHRPADHAREAAALLRLADEAAERPQAVLDVLCDVLMDLCGAQSAGVSLLTSMEADADFKWPAIAGAWAGHVGGSIPRSGSHCGIVVDVDEVLLFRQPEAVSPDGPLPAPPIREMMLAPFRQGGMPVGTVWILAHDETKEFDSEDRRLLVNLSRFAAASYRMLQVTEAGRSAQERLALTLASSQVVGLWDWDIEQNSVVADQRFANLFGVDPAAAASGVPVEAFTSGIHSDDRVRVEAEIRHSVQAGGTFVSEYRVLPIGGGVSHILARGKVERDPQGRPVRFPGVVVDITPQRQAERALHEEQDRYRSLFNSLDTGFCVVEMMFDDEDRPLDYRFIEINPSFVRQTGMGGAVGRTMRELAPDVEPHWFDAFAHVALTGEGIRFENRSATLGDRWFDVHAYRVGAPGRRQVAILFADVTERRRMEERLRASERQFRSMAQALPNHVWTAGPDGQLDWFNSGVLAYFGKDADVLAGEGWPGMVHPADWQASEAAWLQALAGGEPFRAEWRLRQRDGLYRWHIARAVPIRHDDGTIDRWIGTNTDIQDQKELAETLSKTNVSLQGRVDQQTRELRDSEDFTRLALSAVSGVGVWTYDAVANRFTCDMAISKLYGLDPVAGAAGLTPEEFLANVHPDDRASLSATLASGREKPGDLELEYRLCHPDGSVHWVLSRGHTYFEDGRPIRRTGVGVETTVQRQLEEQLRQSQKMEAVGQLTGGIAHDFNNMLTGISGSLELIRLRLAAGRADGVERFLDAALSSTQRAAGLTHRLLAFARRQSLDTKPHDIGRLIAGMEEMLRRTLGEAVRLATHVDDGLWVGLTDANQFENALLNLAINARDAMPAGGQLTIEARNTVLDEAYAKGRDDVVAGDYVAVAVSDNGVGMTADVIAKVFDPFFTTKPTGQGTGLGLSMIYGFAKQSGGHIRVYSEPGRGTTVKLYIRRSMVSEDVGGAVAQDPAPRGTGESVLVVEDDPTVRLLITEVLEELGYRYHEAADATAALEVVASNAVIDLLITDVGLPAMNGRQLAEIARQRRPHLKVLFVTGYAENAALRSDFLAPGMDMMTKPFAMDALAAKVKQLVTA